MRSNVKMFADDHKFYAIVKYVSTNIKLNYRKVLKKQPVGMNQIHLWESRVNKLKDHKLKLNVK